MADEDGRDSGPQKESAAEGGAEGNSEGNPEARVKGFVTDTVKKLFTAGIGAAFMTEESIRKYLGELRLPKDVLGPILHGAAKSKEDLMNVVTNEVVNVIKKIDVVEEASRFVEEHKFKISAEIEVVKKDAAGSSGDSLKSTRVDVKFGKSES